MPPNPHGMYLEHLQKRLRQTGFSSRGRGGKEERRTKARIRPKALPKGNAADDRAAADSGKERRRKRIQMTTSDKEFLKYVSVQLADQLRDFALRPQHYSTFGQLPSSEEIAPVIERALIVCVEARES